MSPQIRVQVRTPDGEVLEGSLRLVALTQQPVPETRPILAIDRVGYFPNAETPWGPAHALEVTIDERWGRQRDADAVLAAWNDARVGPIAAPVKRECGHQGPQGARCYLSPEHDGFHVAQLPHPHREGHIQLVWDDAGQPPRRPDVGTASDFVAKVAPRCDESHPDRPGLGCRRERGHEGEHRALWRPYSPEQELVAWRAGPAREVAR